MTLIINKSNQKAIKKLLKEKLNKDNKTVNIAKHFGQLKRNIDGLTYQHVIRENKIIS